MAHLPDSRTRRVVKYRRGVEVWEYVSGMRRLPGTYWFYDDPGTLDPDYILRQPSGQLGFRIHGTIIQRSKYVPRPSSCYVRKLNPGLQELTTDVARIELTRRNAAILDARVAEERAQLLALRGVQAVDPAETLAHTIITGPAEERVDPATVSNRELRERFAKEQTKRLQAGSLPLKPDTNGADSEAWSPRTVQRRG